MYKHAALSPAIQALEQNPSEDTQKQMFEQQLGQMAYQNFAAKFPDLVEHIVTFKTLGSDAEAGSGFGTFILDLSGETVYVAATFHDSGLSPLEIMYVKSRDAFVPFTTDWVREVERSAHQELGTPAKLPDTVATDVDIRNLVVPPTTGRYSYASLATGAYALEAQSSEALGRGMFKRAEEVFDPLVWEGFVEQYGKIHGMTPGVALDQGQTSLADLANLFKSHEKTWAPPPPPEVEQPQPQQAQQPAMAQPMAPQQAKTAAGALERAGRAMDPYVVKALESGAIGGLIGAGTGVVDDSYHDIGDRAVRGAVGGAALGTLGYGVGKRLNKHHAFLNNYGDEIGHGAGTLLGAIGGAKQPPQNPYGQDPYGQYRYASVQSPADDHGVSLVKHAMAPATPREPKLLDYLTRAPNRVKVAFEQVLMRHPKLLKFTVENYGYEPLRNSLSKHAEVEPKKAPPKGLLVAENYDDTRAFGTKQPQAFRGVQLRGYYYQDTRPSKNLAVQTQNFQNAQDAQDPGVYNFWSPCGKELHTALVFTSPVDLYGNDSQYYPKSPKVVQLVDKVPPRFTVRQDSGALNDATAKTSPARSHEVPRLIVFGDGTYESRLNDVTGEETLPVSLEGSKLYSALFTDEAPTVKAGHGFFAYVGGTDLRCTTPLTISNITKNSRGVITADMEGSSKKLHIDPHASFARPVRPSNGSSVTVPASWRWVSLSDAAPPAVMYTASEVIDRALNELVSKGAKGVRAMDVGGGQISVNGERGLSKAAAIRTLGNDYELSGSAAEAIVKLAKLQGTCDALVIPKRAVVEVAKTASVIEQAFSDVLAGLGTQMENIQSQMQVLQTVQQRAQELSSQQGQDPTTMQQTDPAMQPEAQPGPQGAPQEPNAQPAPQQGAPQPAVPGMPVEQPQQAQQPAAPPPPQPAAPPQDPNALPAPQQGAPMDPNGMPPQEEVPQVPIMHTEEPSSEEIAQQINPDFLQQATQLNQQGVFDVSALGELQRAAQRTGDTESRGLGDSEKQDLAGTVDDLGRTLLTMQLRQGELREQLSDNTYQDLEDQVRNTFKSLGKLMLELAQHTAALTHVQDETAA